MNNATDSHDPPAGEFRDRDAALAAALPRQPVQPPRLAWIPIRALGPGHRPRILQHLLALSEHDRYLRFGFLATDEQVSRYVDSLDFNRDEVFGVYNRRLQLVAVAHLAYPPEDNATAVAAEFGGSVSSHLRGRGYGARLFEHAMLHARNRGLDTLFIHALSENTAMLRIARKAGGKVERAGGESDAYVKLPPETLASQVEQLVGDGAAELDYRLKQQARAVRTLLGALDEVRQGVVKSGQAGQG